MRGGRSGRCPARRERGRAARPRCSKARNRRTRRATPGRARLRAGLLRNRAREGGREPRHRISCSRRRCSSCADEGAFRRDRARLLSSGTSPAGSPRAGPSCPSRGARSRPVPEGDPLSGGGESIREGAAPRPGANNNDVVAPVRHDFIDAGARPLVSPREVRASMRKCQSRSSFWSFSRRRRRSHGTV